MTGPFPGKELEDLTNLENLDLSRSSFNGSLEFQDLSTMKMLKSLNLSYNQFLDPMGFQGNKSLSTLRNLEILDLSRNAFTKTEGVFSISIEHCLFLVKIILMAPYPYEFHLP